MSEPDFLIVEAIYPGMMPLDFVGPHAIFTRIPKTTTVVASEPGGSIEAEDGLVFAGVRRMNEVEAMRPIVRSRRPRDRHHQRPSLHA